MPLVELVVHCYAAELLHYAQALVYQVSSLVLHRPKKCGVKLTVCYCMDDLVTSKFLSDWMELSYHTDGTYIDTICFDRTRIGRRAIGRNFAAKATKADFVWFADVDQVFRDGVLDRLVELEWPEDAVMIYPQNIMIHRDHKTGDERTSAVDLDNPLAVDIDPSEFIPKRYRKAIGGVQIVKGDFARKHGYLDGDNKWQRPTDEPFGDFRDDIAYRNFCLQHGKIVGVDLPGMFRLRHSRTTYQ